MFNFIKNMFSSSNDVPINNNDSSYSTSSRELITLYLKEELRKKSVFNLESEDILYKHLTGELNLNKTENLLSKEEKSDLGINTRLKVTRDLINVFNRPQLNGKSPKKLLTNLETSINKKVSRNNTLENAKNIGVTQFTLNNCEDERDCKWSNKIKNKKFNINEDINKLIDENCTADSCRCIVISDIKF